MNTYRFGKHTIELSMSSSGKYSPWHLDDFKKKGKFVIATSDIGFFMRVDGKSIYKVIDGITFSHLNQKIGKMQSDYDYYPAETEEEFRLILNSPELYREPDID